MCTSSIAPLVPKDYAEVMATVTVKSLATEENILDRIFDPLTLCLTPGVARKMIALRADPELQARIDELAEKCNRGTINEAERTDYETYVRAIHFVTVLQSKARRLISHHS